VISTLSCKRIDRIAEDFLEGAGVHEPPVRRERLFMHAGLREVPFHPSEFPAENPPGELPPGMLDLPGRTAYLDRTQPEGRKRFTAMHELAHWVLPWHRETLMTCCEWDLPDKIQKDLEAEADRFAARCLFLGDGFKDDARELPFHLDSLLRLKELYEVSHHASLIEYARAHRPEAALIILGRNGAGRAELRGIRKARSCPIRVPFRRTLPRGHFLARSFEDLSPGAPRSVRGTWTRGPYHAPVRGIALDTGREALFLIRMVS